MSDSGVEAELRRLAGEYRANPDDAARKALQTALLPHVAGIVRKLMSDPTGRADAATDFLIEKVPSTAFVDAFLRPDRSSMAVLWTAVRHFVIDLRRKKSQAEVVGDSDVADQVADDPYARAEELLATAEVNDTQRERLDALPEKDRALWDAAYGNANEASAAWIANKRGVTAAQVMSEIEARAELREERQRPHAEDWKMRRARLHRIRRQLDHVRAEVARRGESPSYEKGDAPTRYPSRDEELLNWAGEELRQLEGALLRREADTVRLVHEARAGFIGLGHWPDWENLGIIMGEVSADATGKERKDGSERIRKQFERLARRLRAQAIGEDFDD